jgi:hypothetical protein
VSRKNPGALFFVRKNPEDKTEKAPKGAEIRRFEAQDALDGHLL